MFTMIASTVVVLGVLIFVHELGHFLVAKRAGVTVLRFSLGFGPKLIGVQRGDTEYRLSLIPLGGYVKMLGEESEEELSEDQLKTSFQSQSPLKRIAIVLAGPMSNFVMAVVLFFLVFALVGIPQVTTRIGEVTADSPAEKAGLLAGDKVLAIDGKELANWGDIPQTIEETQREELTLLIERGDQKLTIKVSPKVSEIKTIFGEPILRKVIGVMPSEEKFFEQVSLVDALSHCVSYTVYLCKLFLISIVKLIQRVLPLDMLGGPIMIAQLAGREASKGFADLVLFTGAISVNLAVLNLLPVPVLDGGHILFYLIELLLGRSIGVRKMEIAQKIGMILLLALMILVFYNDIVRLLPGHKPSLP